MYLTVEKGNLGKIIWNDAKAETPVLWPPHAKSWLIVKDSDAGRDRGQEEKEMAEDKMAGWHHRLNGCEFEWTPGIGDVQGGLACRNSWGRKESDTTERLNWTELIPDIGLPRWLGGKDYTCQCKRYHSIPGWEDPLEKETATHSSILAWEIPWTEEPGGLQSIEVRHAAVTKRQVEKWKIDSTSLLVFLHFSHFLPPSPKRGLSWVLWSLVSCLLKLFCIFLSQ